MKPTFLEIQKLKVKITQLNVRTVFMTLKMKKDILKKMLPFTMIIK